MIYVIQFYDWLQFKLLSFDGEFYHSVESSKFPHRRTYGLANYRGSGLITGCDSSNAECSFKTEILDMTTLKWSDGPNYPFGSG